MATKVAEAALESGMKKVVDEAGEYVAEKIFTKQAKDTKPLSLIITEELKKT